MGATAAQEKPTDIYRLPDAKVLEEAGQLQVLDKDGNKVDLKSFYTNQPTGEKQLIVFIRHFLCGFCEEYVRALARDLPPKLLESVDTKLTIVGCGDHTLIADYATRTGCPYPIYCDPSRATYEKLGMVCSLNQKGKPDYLSRSQLSLIKSSLFTALGMGVGKAWKAGKISQNGGEWVFKDGTVEWCRRMQHTADHAEIPELKTVLGL
ncbi:uncharacterized protein K489DRAFT_382239 [Dissoconium aciculare CBS 342.82]|uniref:AhpC/TSA antioxidant enzyme-domain-containing protein n=1 Tax=Dissoconium aciculare CBS 342.82 TaxID=1314786 RepID=A0A6J3LZI2_9PEZI|nr:uncharacterized protein K489DRAFT_382239 [Dissoconium aciculare CBS 342.82]KAF1821195.1 hypothetical protein K489DRAFT_382239 [Dissoconium aciculare CBS 342.82]